MATLDQLNDAVQAALTPSKLDEMYDAIDENFEGSISKATFFADAKSPQSWDWNGLMAQLMPHGRYDGTICAEVECDEGGHILGVWVGDQ